MKTLLVILAVIILVVLAFVIGAMWMLGVIIEPFLWRSKK